jgi:4'-phosphopantetheinyl transferase EntD
MRTARSARPLGRTPFTLAIAHRAAIGTEILTAAERSEYDALRYDIRRGDWLAGRCAAKRAVARRRGASIHRLCLMTQIAGAPICWLLAHGSWTPLAVTLSIGHCDGVAVAAASDPTTPVGVDVEREGTIAPHERRLFLGTGERALRRLDATLAWVLKEAAWKALRLNADLPFAALELDVTNDDRLLRGVRVDSEWQPARAYVVRLPRLLGMVAAVVALEAA